jgi:hypothetical protein
MGRGLPAITEESPVRDYRISGEIWYLRLSFRLVTVIKYTDSATLLYF